MGDVTCFIEPFGWCISQENAISGAFVTALGSLLTTGWRIYADRGAKRAHQAFETSERSARQEFVTGERAARERFEAGQSAKASMSEEEVQKKLETFGKLEDWRAESWQRVLTRIDEAWHQLSHASTGLTALIDEGPFWDDLRMIKETAAVLDVFGDFQTSVSHYNLPGPLATASATLVTEMTTILLTLSPSQDVRASFERKAQLSPHRAELLRLVEGFSVLCREFERNPGAFIANPQEASQGSS